MERQKRGYRGYRDLKVYQLSYQLALEIHEISKVFPKEEKYALVDQIRGWKKRRYEKAFIAKVIDAAGEAGETEVWLDFSKDFGYLHEDKYQDLMSKYDEVNRMLYGMVDKADKFIR
jgi:four helix bundle protein